MSQCLYKYEITAVPVYTNACTDFYIPIGFQ